MKVYSINLTLKSPLIIAGSKYGRIIEHSVKYIPGQSIRGAILTLLKFMGSSIVQDEIDKPNLIFHPAYPLFEDKIAFPADPLTFKCKVCGEIMQCKIPPTLDELSFPLTCSNGHMYTLKNIGGTLLIKNGNELKEFKLKYVIIDSTGINKTLRSSELGLLYSYVALTPKTKFKGIIVDPHDKLETMFEEVQLDMKNLELRIGRRKSAGLGLVQAKITEIGNYIESRISKIEESSGEKALLAKSPIFHLEYRQGKKRNFSIVSTIKNEINGFPVKYVLKTSNIYVSGYSVMANIPKPSISALDIGSIITFQEKIPTKKLVEMELYGIGPFTKSGLNIVEVMSR